MKFRRCGFSKTLIGILNKEGIEYSTFDILDDESVRQSTSPFLLCPPRLTKSRQS